MLTLVRNDHGLTIETGSFRATWDASRGGQIAQYAVKDDLFTHELLTEGRLIPDLRLTVGGKMVALSSAVGKLELIDQSIDRIVFENTATLLDGAVRVTQTYEVFPEGVMFCEQAIELLSGHTLEISDVSMNIAIDTRGARSARWGHYMRDPWYKRDYSTVHAFMNHSLFRPLDQGQDSRQLFPLVSLDLGWEATRFFSCHLEFGLEDWTHFVDGPLSNTRTRAGLEDGRWQLHWHFHDGSTIRASGPKRYRNRWVAMAGRPRTRSGADSDPAVRNNILGCRVCHCMYPYARKGDEWPWVVMPIKQIPEQPPQLFRGLPDPARAEEAAAVGANVFILHQFWMSNPGSNNEPPADYKPVDADWLRAITERAHKAGLRVLLYTRGTEMWQHYSSFFEDFCRRDWDGVYTDWATPLGMGYIKCSPLHFSAYNFFMFCRQVRKRIGSGGASIAHTGNSTYLALGTFDATVGGEFSIRHDELLGVPEQSSYYSLVNCVGGHLISGNLPDRVAFSSRRSMAVCSALGMTGHPFMEPDEHFSKPAAYIKPLWDAMRALPGKPVRLHNPTYSPTRAIRTDAPDLYPSCFQSDSHKALLLVTNLDTNPASGTVEVDLRELDVPTNARFQVLEIDGAAGPSQCTVDGRCILLNDIPPLYFAAVLIG